MVKTLDKEQSFPTASVGRKSNAWQDHEAADTKIWMVLA